MASIDFAPKLSPRFVVYLRDYLMDRHIDPQPVLSQCGIEQITESESALPISTSKMLELFDVAAEKSNDPLLGFNMARHFHYESSAVVVLAMLAAPTVAEGLTTLSFFDKYVDAGITTSYDFTGRTASFSPSLLGVDGTQTGHLNEYMVTFTVHSLNIATRKSMPLQSVHLQHVRDVGKEQLEEFFGAKVQYGQPDNTICFDSSYLNEHLFTSNALLYDILQNALKTYFSADVRRHGFIDSVCRELMRQSEIQTTDLQYVANALSMSARTLRRRMKEEGFSFQQVKNLARERQTKYYLANTNMSLSEIAFSLGYAELSSFSRAFKKWTGSTPQDYRATARKLMSA